MGERRGKARGAGIRGLLMTWLAYAVHGAGAQEVLASKAAPRIQTRAEILWTKAIAKETGRYAAWPSVCVRSNGEIIVVYSGDRDAHVCPYGKVRLTRSPDGGETWTAPVTAMSSLIDDRDAGIVELKDGTLLLAWFTSLAYRDSFADPAKVPPGSRTEQWMRHDAKLPEGLKRDALGHFVARSEDGGKSWSLPVRTKGSSPHGPIPLSDGRLLYVGRYFEGEECVISVEESKDGGLSWQTISRILPAPGEDAPLMFHEPHAVEVGDGKIVVQIRYHGEGYRLRQSESADGGRTWTAMAETPLAGFPPHLLRLSDGRLLSAYARRFGEYGEYASLSDDGGRTWDVANEIKLALHFSGDLGYPASVELPDGSILTVYYQAERKGEPPSIMATKWRAK